MSTYIGHTVTAAAASIATQLPAGVSAGDESLLLAFCYCRTAGGHFVSSTWEIAYEEGPTTPGMLGIYYTNSTAGITTGPTVVVSSLGGQPVLGVVVAVSGAQSGPGFLWNDLAFTGIANARNIHVSGCPAAGANPGTAWAVGVSRSETIAAVSAFGNTDIVWNTLISAATIIGNGGTMVISFGSWTSLPTIVDHVFEVSAGTSTATGGKMFITLDMLTYTGIPIERFYRRGRLPFTQGVGW